MTTRRIAAKQNKLIAARKPPTARFSEPVTKRLTSSSMRWSGCRAHCHEPGGDDVGAHRRRRRDSRKTRKAGHLHLPRRAYAGRQAAPT